MLNLEQNDDKIKSPSKTFKVFNATVEDKDGHNKNAYNSPDNKPISQINNSFSSPCSKKILILSESNSYNNTGSGNDNNNIYSPYVKRINISGNKMEFTKDNYLNTYFNSNKKATKKIYTPSPNFDKSEKLNDRFIPLNKGINLMEKFNLTTKFEEADENNINNDINKEENDNKDIYDEMLKTNFLNEYNSSSLMNKLIMSKKNNNDKDISSSLNKIKLIFHYDSLNNYL